MRIKNPDDQKFIVKSTEQLSKADVDELPALSTGEALISGRSIPAPLLVRVGYKALKHGGELPKISGGVGAWETAVTMVARDIERALRAEFEALVFAKSAFPMLTAWGVEDFSVTIHSLGCNYLSALGRELGFLAISEYPVRVTAGANACSVRPDVAWWSQPNPHVVLLGEFERYDPRQQRKLVGKARNLLRAHHELGDRSRVLLLMTWAFVGTDLRGLDEVRAVAHDGCRTSDGLVVTGLGAESTFIVATAVFGGSGEQRQLRVVRA